jgi:hypothetical protein
LPYITPSGCFRERKKSKIKTYSGIVHADIDNVCRDAKYCVSTLKQIIFSDKFLNPAFIFVSPSGKGLKIFIRIRGAEEAFHKEYFRVISEYLKKQYDIVADPSCSDISRACFLCHDSEALFSPFGCVTHTELLKKFPPKPPEPPSIIALFKTLYSNFYGTDYTRYKSDKLNHCPEIHKIAVRCLVNEGWVQNGIYFTRPGKENSNAVSATFDVPDTYDIHIFYNFSSNAQPFNAGQGYTDCMVISRLHFKGDYDLCVNALYKKYYSMLKQAG